MFSLKLNSISNRLNNVVTRTCGLKQYVLSKKHSLALSISYENECKTLNYSLVNITPFSLSNKFLNNRTFCTDVLPKNPDVFGDIGNKKYDLVELDEVEEKIEEFDENEAKPMRRYRKTPGQYAAMIKEHIQNGDLGSAENVLEIIKNNRDKPTLYMYNLLLRAFAFQGDSKKCFKLYNDFKKRGMMPNEATITSLINSCSNSLSSKSLEVLHDFRRYLFIKKYDLNETHYNALIKAYSRHNQIEESFQLLDEMRDKKLRIDEITFNNLLHGASCEKTAGIKYALVVWHLMKYHHIKPGVNTYNLLFRAIRDTELGNLKVNDILIQESEKSKVVVVDGGRPDLLAVPPVVRTVPLLTPSSNNRAFSKRHNAKDIVESESENKDPSEIDLNKILRRNRLILFGGFDGLMKRMEDDGVIPDVKSFSLCLELIPNTKEAEMHVIHYARSKKISLDAGFYNILIKRRCFRFDYVDARDVLGEMEKDGCEPDIITWGVIAMSCQTQEDGMALLKCLENVGITPNYFIYGSLLRTAANNLKLEYVIDLMQSMFTQKIRPSQLIYSILDKLKVNAADAIAKEGPRIKDLDRFKIEYTKFKLRYEKLQKINGRKNIFEKSTSD